MKVNLTAQKAHERGEDCGREGCKQCDPKAGAVSDERLSHFGGSDNHYEAEEVD